MSSARKRIVCAVRGGRECRGTVSHAIGLALEMERPLTFFHVLDVEFLGYAAPAGPLSIAHRQLGEMAEFAMLILSDRAARRGVEDVNYAIRKGNFREQLRDFLGELPVHTLVLGTPTRSPAANRFTLEEIRALMEELESQFQIQVVLAPCETATQT